MYFPKAYYKLFAKLMARFLCFLIYRSFEFSRFTYFLKESLSKRVQRLPHFSTASMGYEEYGWFPFYRLT
jgi:hypothetical protein